MLEKIGGTKGVAIVALLVFIVMFIIYKKFPEQPDNDVNRFIDSILSKQKNNLGG